MQELVVSMRAAGALEGNRFSYSTIENPENKLASLPPCPSGDRSSHRTLEELVLCQLSSTHQGAMAFARRSATKHGTEATQSACCFLSGLPLLSDTASLAV